MEVISKGTLLIIDESRNHRDRMIKLLNEFSFDGRIVEAESPYQGLLKLMEFSPSIVMVDIRLYFSNGINLIEKLRTINPGLRFLIATSYSTAECYRPNPEDLMDCHYRDEEDHYAGMKLFLSFN